MPEIMNTILSGNNIYYVGGGIALVIFLLFFVLRSKKKSIKETSLTKETEVPSALAEVRESKVAKRDIQSLLAKTREAFTAKLDALLLETKKFDESFIEGLEELLYTSDLGPKTVEKLLVAVRAKLSRGELSELSAVKEALYKEILGILNGASGSGEVQGPLGMPWVILVVGVNGVGKTTSIGKLAHFYSSQNKKVLVVAGDTFRAAAEQQLSVWGKRAQVEVYTSEQTKDPAAVAFQGIQKGLSENFEVIIVDTAGRLHTKENLMEELKKIKRAAGKALEKAPHEIILVIDANSGQNAKVQAQQFNEALNLTSLIVTKLDGTARGGVIVGIAEEIGVGVQFIGTGEGLDDLQKFSVDEYAKGLLQLD